MDYDCAGYQIKHNTSTNASGILLAGTNANRFDNITIRNCPNVTQYRYGVDLRYTSNSTIRNITSYDNTELGFQSASSSNNTYFNNTAATSTYSGFYFTNSQSGNNALNLNQ